MMFEILRPLPERPRHRPLRVGLTGGIGSGKSSVAALLRDHGAVVVDADEVARELVEPGQPLLDALTREFGSRIVSDDGTLDRAALADIVFADPQAKAQLDSLMLPAIAMRSHELLSAVPVGQVAVYDMPLLVETDAADAFDVVIVVEASRDTRLERLEKRGVSRADAQARMGVQATDEQRREVADVLIHNAGSQADLASSVEDVWGALTGADTP